MMLNSTKAGNETIFKDDFIYYHRRYNHQTKAQPFRIEIANTCKRGLAFLGWDFLAYLPLWFFGHATKVLDYGGRKWKNLHSNDNNLC